MLPVADMPVHRQETARHLVIAKPVGPQDIPGQSQAPPDYSHYPALIGADLLHAEGLTGDGVTIAVIDTGLWPWQSVVEDTAGEARLGVPTTPSATSCTSATT